MGRKKVKFPQRPRLALLKGVNLNAVARALKVSVPTVFQIRHGKLVANTPIGRRVRAELARMSGRTVADIWPGMDT